MKICMECKWHERRGIEGKGAMLTDHCMILGGMQDCVTGGIILGERCRVMRLSGPCGREGLNWEPRDTMPKFIPPSLIKL